MKNWKEVRAKMEDESLAKLDFKLRALIEEWRSTGKEFMQNASDREIQAEGFRFKRCAADLEDVLDGRE